MREYPGNSFLLSPQKRMLWVLIRSDSPQNVCCGYLLEVPQWGTSNEYPQHVFMEKYAKYYFLVEKKKTTFLDSEEDF